MSRGGHSAPKVLGRWWIKRGTGIRRDEIHHIMYIEIYHYRIRKISRIRETDLRHCYGIWYRIIEINPFIRNISFGKYCAWFLKTQIPWPCVLEKEGYINWQCQQVFFRSYEIYMTKKFISKEKFTSSALSVSKKYSDLRTHTQAWKN